jgi:hypothetical protein
LLGKLCGGLVGLLACLASGEKVSVSDLFGRPCVAASLNQPADGQVPFLNVHLEQVIAAYRSTGPRDHTAALHERYTNWRAVGRVIRDIRGR